MIDHQKALTEIISAYGKGNWQNRKGLEVKLNALEALIPLYPTSNLLQELLSEVRRYLAAKQKRERSVLNLKVQGSIT